MDSIRIFKPSCKELIQQSWLNAQGLWRWWFGNDIRKCCICGRQEDYLLELVQLIPIFDLNDIVYICDDHGRVTNFNCLTGEAILLPLPRPHWYRSIRNLLQGIVLQSIILFRFIWFTLCNFFMWYIVFEIKFIAYKRHNNG